MARSTRLTPARRMSALEPPPVTVARRSERPAASTTATRARDGDALGRRGAAHSSCSSSSIDDLPGPPRESLEVFAKLTTQSDAAPDLVALKVEHPQLPRRGPSIATSTRPGGVVVGAIAAQSSKARGGQVHGVASFLA